MKSRVLIPLFGIGVCCALGATTQGCSDTPKTSAPPPAQETFHDPVYVCLPSLGVNPVGSSVMPIADVADPVTTTFHVVINPVDPSLTTQELVPRIGPATVTGGLPTLSLTVGTKKLLKKPGVLWLDLLLETTTAEGLRDGTFEIEKLDPALELYDWTKDIWSGPTASRTIAFGGIAPEGATRTVIALGAISDQPISFDITLKATTTKRTSTSSMPAVITPSGAELWATFPDGDVVSIIDTQKRERAASVTIEGAPSSIAMTPDATLAVVTAPGCNQVVVVDVATRAIVQRFGETDGIGRSPQNVVLSPDGTRAYVSSYVGDTIAVFERKTDGFALFDTIDAGRRPMGLGVSPDGNTVYAAHFLPRGPIDSNEAWISVIDAKTRTKLTDGVIPDATNPKYVDCLHQISLFKDTPIDDLKMESVQSGLWGVFLNPAGTEAFVLNNIIVPFPVLEGDFTKAGIAFKPGSISTSTVVPFNMLDRNAVKPKQLDTVYEIEDRSPEFLQCYDPPQLMEFPTRYDVANRPGIMQSRGATRPTGDTALFETGVIRHVAFTRGGRRALFVSYTSDEISVQDAATHHGTAQKHLTLEGSNPRAVVVSPDGTQGWVVYDNSIFATELDLSAYAQSGNLPKPGYVPFWLEQSDGIGATASLASFRWVTRDITNVPELPPINVVGNVPLVDKDPMDPVMRRGKVLFSSANPDKYPELSVHREASCSNCHPNGGNDGSVWPTVEGERRTSSLRGGIRGRGWLHASATHRDAHEFVDVITRERLGGTGLSAADIDALSTYLATGIPRLQRPKVDEAKAAAGEALFAAKCASCHVGLQKTSGNPDYTTPYGGAGENEPGLYDVGSQTSRAGVIIGPAFAQFFAEPLKTMVNMMRGDRAFAPDDFVFKTMAASPRPTRALGVFKATPLVNVWENAVFFHDGRYTTLEEVIEHFNTTLKLDLSAEEKSSLVEYMKTL